MNTWCSYAEYMEAIEKQLNEQISKESLVYFKFVINAMGVTVIGSPEFNLMQSINSKTLTHYYRGWGNNGKSTNTPSVIHGALWYRINDNKQIMKRYAKRINR